MKLMQDYVVCNIRKHGKFHVSDIHVCPECYSSNIGNMHDILNALQLSKDGRGTYWCRDCGCEFSETCTSQPTHLGKVIGVICKVLSMALFIAALLIFVFGVITIVTVVSNRHTFDVGDIITFTFGLPTLALLFSVMLRMVEDDLLKVSEKKDKTEESEKNK